MRLKRYTVYAAYGPQVDLGDGFFKRLWFWFRVKSTRRVCYTGHSAESAQKFLEMICEKRGIIGLVFVSKDGMIFIDGTIPLSWRF